jgi:hypothetical protein
VSHRRRLAGVSLALVAAAAFAGACGSSSNATPTSAPASNGGGGTNAMAGYLSCLRSNGVNIPDVNPSGRPFPTARPSARPSGAPRPSFSPGEGGRRGGFPGGGFLGSTPPSGVSQETWDKARQACAALEPSFNAQGRRGGDNGAFAAYRNCLSDHGVTVNGPGQQMNTADPKTAAALKACEPLRPTARPSAS